MQLYLIRHPKPEVAEGICYGATDLALASDPAAIAATLRFQLPSGIPLFSSPLRRCLTLAQALHPRPLSDPRLKEMNFGAWEMCAWSSIERKALDAWAANPLHYAPPGGESAYTMQQRVLSFVAELQSRKQDAVALVTHAGVIKIILGHVQAMTPAEWMQLRFDYGSVVRVVCTGQAERHNEQSKNGHQRDVHFL